MAHAGQTIENPVTRERVHFLVTSQETNGEYTRAEVTVQPDGFVAAAHLHPNQDERFEIVAGELEMRLDGHTVVGRAGDVIVVPMGTKHQFRNVTDEEVRFVEVRPALQFEQLLETMYALAADGKTNRKGMPNPLRLAVIANAHFDDVRLPFPPAWMQRVGLALGAPLGRVLGYGATYTPAAGAGDVAAAAI